MAFVAFGKLPYGTVFGFKEAVWVKLPPLTIEPKAAYNAANADEFIASFTAQNNGEIEMPVEYFDHGNLVNTNTNIDPSLQQRLLDAYATVPV